MNFLQALQYLVNPTLAVLPIDLVIAQVHTIVLEVAADQAGQVPGQPNHLAVLPIDPNPPTPATADAAAVFMGPSHHYAVLQRQLSASSCGSSFPRPRAASAQQPQLLKANNSLQPQLNYRHLRFKMT